MERARGGVPSVGVVKRRVLRGLWRRLVGVGIIGSGLYGAPAFILSLAALYGPPPSAAFPLRPLCVAQERRRCEHDYPRWDAHTIPSAATTSVLGAPASIIGPELSSLLGSGPLA